jgi:DNA-directed RNA polymerase subunit beta'
VIYYEDYIVIEPGKTRRSKPKQLLTENEYREAREEYGDDSSSPRWAPRPSASCCKRLDLDATVAELQEQMRTTRSRSRSARSSSKRLKVVERLHRSREHARSG